MIFKPVLIHAIACGKKTQTRRPVKTRETEPRWKVGRAYAAQPGRGKAATAHFIVEAVRMEPLGALTFEDARREGFKTRDDFNAYWTELYGTLDLERLVWVVTFRLDDRDMPRLLAARTGRGDYTSDVHQAVRDEPEAISEGDHERLHQHAAAKDHAHRRVPLMSSMENLCRDLDAIRDRVASEGIADASVRQTVRALGHHAEVLRRKLAP